MPERLPCRVENVRVRPDRRDTLERLVYKMFERRHHAYVTGQEHDWLTVELVQSLRRESVVYREELSTQTSGPLPFALGYFQLTDQGLTLTTDQVPGNMAPHAFLRFLSEFVQPGARLWFGAGEEEQGWEIRGEDEVFALHRGTTQQAD